MGLSSYKPGRRILDWPDDVVELADYLQIDRFAVVGFCSGGPYVFACLQNPRPSHRLRNVSGAGQVSWFVAFLSRWVPWLVLPVTRRWFQDEALPRQF